MSGGFLEVGLTERGDEIIINHPDLQPDEHGEGHIIFSVEEARGLAKILIAKAAEAEHEMQRKADEEKRKVAEAVPVDRNARTLSDGSPVTEDHREIISGGVRDGQQKGYVVLSDAERAKGFVRPLRYSYLHVGRRICAKPHGSRRLGGIVQICFLESDHDGECTDFRDVTQPEAAAAEHTHKLGGCGVVTTMGPSIAETYARDPKFYSGTFCVGCHAHFPLDQFVWSGTNEQVGS